MLEFFQRLFRGEDQSKQVAKERLRLVLVQDRMSLSSDELNDLKEELLDVISKYFEIEDVGPEVNFEQDGEAIAFVATIPVKRSSGIARAGK